MNKIFIAHDPLEANFVRDLLEQQGIDAEVQGEALFGLRPRIGNASDTLPSVWIRRDAQLKKALKFVAEYEQGKTERDKSAQ